MSKSAYSYIRDAWKSPGKTEVKAIQWERLQKWRRELSIVRVEHPTRLDRARQLGYKAKQGIVVARVKIRRGGSRKRRPVHGRRTVNMGVHKLTRGKSLQRMAEERTSRRYPNMEVLNSYWVGQDGRSKWFEVILVDPVHPAIMADKDLKWITMSVHRGRAFRGLTIAGRRGRGLMNRGLGAEKIRPSLGAHKRKGK